jgi:hypothetical protein
MMKYLRLLLLVAIVTLPLVSFISFSCTSTSGIDDSIVQIWDPAGGITGGPALIAFGITAGDGSQALTVLDYEDYSPGELEVKINKHTYKGVVQAIDPRTSATLLNIEGLKMLPAPVADSSMISSTQKIIIRGWLGDKLKKEQAEITQIPSVTELHFNVSLTQEEVEKEGWGVFFMGTPVTDENDRVLGLVTPFYNKLVFHSIPLGWIPPVVCINSAMELLNPDAAVRPWVDGPVLTTLTVKNRTYGYNSGILSYVSDYPAMTAAIRELLQTLGEPLAYGELPENYNKLVWPESTDGTFLTMVYARPVELKNTNDDLLAKAKWVGIQWDRSEGRPNRLMYGWVDKISSEYHVQGGFALKGDITGLEKTLHPAY